MASPPQVCGLLVFEIMSTGCVRAHPESLLISKHTGLFHSRGSAGGGKTKAARSEPGLLGYLVSCRIRSHDVLGNSYIGAQCGKTMLLHNFAYFISHREFSNASQLRLW